MRVAFLIVLAMFGCKRSNTTSRVEKTKIQLNWVPEPEFGGIYAARDIGAYQRAGIEVEIQAGAAGTPVIQIVASGQADFGVVGADDVVLARARGIDIVAVHAAFQHSPQGVMVHKSRGIEKLEDLKGGTLAIEPGLPFGGWIKKKYGFAGVTIVPYDGGVAKFIADTSYAQQCYVTAEPIAAKRKGIDAKVFTARETGFDPYANVIVVRGALLKTKMALVRSFVAATNEGWRAYLADPKPVNATMAKLNTGMDLATFEEAARTQESLVRGEAELGTMTEARYTDLAAQLVALGVITKAPPANECVAKL